MATRMGWEGVSPQRPPTRTAYGECQPGPASLFRPFTPP